MDKGTIIQHEIPFRVEVCQFQGIRIFVDNEVKSPRRFHVTYEQQEATLDILTLRYIQGSLPDHVKSLVFQWSTLHLSALLDNIKRCQAGEQPLPISPLVF